MNKKYIEVTKDSKISVATANKIKSDDEESKHLRKFASKITKVPDKIIIPKEYLV